MPTKAKASTTAKKDDAGEAAPAKKASAAAKGAPKAASAGKSASGKKVNPALMKPLQPSKELAAVVGSDPLPRPEVVKGVGLHQEEQPPEPSQQARDQRGRQTPGRVRQKPGDHVRDEQASRSAPEITARGPRVRRGASCVPQDPERAGFQPCCSPALLLLRCTKTT